VNDSVVVISIVTAIATGTPILLAAVGETLTERSGVMNLGIEGMMLLGAVSGFWVTSETGSLGLGILVGALAGALLALIHAVLAVSLRVNQIISGLALVIIGTGLSSFLGDAADPKLTSRPPGARFSQFFPESLSDLPIVGPIVFGHDIVVYLSWILVAVTSYFLFRTRPGLSVWAVGEDPATADAAGISVAKFRYSYTLVGGVLAGVGGAYLSSHVLGTWQDELTAGMGWIAFTLVIFSGWRPWRALFAAYIFGAITSLGFTLQILGFGVPTDFLAMLPFIMTIVALAFISARPAAARRLGAPAALGISFARESR
jgi:general nucleoside transport system permease protein